MSEDARVMARAVERYNNRARARREELARRTEKLSEELPRIDEITREMQMTGLSIARAALNLDTSAVERRVKEIGERNLALQKERETLLISHGYPGDYLYAGPACKVCDDTGFHDGNLCDCLSELYREELAEELRVSVGGTPATFAGYNEEGFIVTGVDENEMSRRERREQLQRVKDYAARLSLSRRGLLLMGDAGCGKTTLAVCVASKAVRQGLTALYISAGRYFDLCEEERFRGSEAASEELSRYRSCDVLILDDLGTEAPGNMTAAAFFGLLNAREIAGLPTILCTGLTYKQMEQKYSAAAVSRIENGFEVIELRGEDLRRVKNTFLL